MIKWTALTLMVLSPLTALCQIVDIQSEANKKTKDGLTGAISGRWDRLLGNTNIAASSLSGLLRWRGGDHLVMGIVKREYGQKSEVEYINNHFAHLRYRYSLNKFLDGELFLQTDHNRFRGYTSRNLVGTGPLLKWVDEDDLTVYTGIAVMQEEETRTKETQRPDEENPSKNPRYSLSFAYSQTLAQRFNLSASAYYQPAVTDNADHRLSANGAIGVSLTERLSYTFTVSVVKDSLPPPGIKEVDQSYRNGLKFVF